MRALSKREMQRVSGGGDTITVTGTPPPPWDPPIFLFPSTGFDLSYVNLFSYDELTTDDELCTDDSEASQTDGTSIFANDVPAEVAGALDKFIQAAQTYGQDIQVSYAGQSYSLGEILTGLGNVSLTFGALDGGAGQHLGATQQPGNTFAVFDRIIIDMTEVRAQAITFDRTVMEEFYVTLLHELVHKHDYVGGDGQVGKQFSDAGNPGALDFPDAIKELMERAAANGDDLSQPEQQGACGSGGI